MRADPEYDAGITGAMEIARVAEGFGLDVEFHAPGPAQRHCIAATRNTSSIIDPSLVCLVIVNGLIPMKTLYIANEESE